MEKLSINQMEENPGNNCEVVNQDLEERRSGIVKIVGGSVESQEKAKLMFSELFDAVGENADSVKDLNREQLRRVEKVKTPEELALLEEVFEKLREFVESYGGNSLAISPDHCIFIDQTKLSLVQRLYYNFISGVAGAFSSRHQVIALFNAKAEGSKLRLAQLVVHEALHLSSFQSFTVPYKDKDIENVNSDNLKVRRVGFAIVSEKNDNPVVFFKGINEAITEELVRIFDKKYLKDISSLKDEVKKREDYSSDWEDENSNKNIACLVGRGKGLFYSVEPLEYGYVNERSNFHNLIHAIYMKNKEDFSSTEEVFNVFAKSYFRGSLLEVAKLIEKTYGKGSFRSMAEKSKQNWTTDKDRE